jgi:hypothetical protein
LQDVFARGRDERSDLLVDGFLRLGRDVGGVRQERPLSVGREHVTVPIVRLIPQRPTI